MVSNTINQKADLLEELLTTSTQQLSNTVTTFNDTNFNVVPFEGSWTATQVSEHVLKSLELIDQLVQAPTQSTDRNPEEHVATLREIMENFEVKAKSAPNLLPGDEPMTKTMIQNRLLQCQKQMIQSISSLDLSETCMASEFPVIGYLTRYELISFAAFHTQRHIHQIKNIHKILTNNPN